MFDGFGSRIGLMQLHIHPCVLSASCGPLWQPRRPVALVGQSFVLCRPVRRMMRRPLPIFSNEGHYEVFFQGHCFRPVHCPQGLHLFLDAGVVGHVRPMKFAGDLSFILTAMAKLARRGHSSRRPFFGAEVYLAIGSKIFQAALLAQGEWCSHSRLQPVPVLRPQSHQVKSMTGQCPTRL